MLKKNLSGLLLAIFVSSSISACGTNNIQYNDSLNQASSMARTQLGHGTYNNFRISPDLPKADKKRKAVKLTYLMTDDTAHQSPWSDKMLAMMDDMPQKDVHNIVFRDGNKNGDSRIYYMQGDNNVTTIRSPQSTLAPGVGEVQSNNPKVFSEVLGWTFSNYPAQRHYLQIYTHGGGVFGIGTDKNQVTPGGKAIDKANDVWLISPSDFAEALKQGLKGRKLDLIYFRACLMGNMEALYELRGTTDYVLASEDVSYSVENSNLAMTSQFDDLASQNTAPAELARQMSIKANAKNGNWRDGYTTMAAIDIDRLTDLKTAINRLALALKSELKTDSKTILAAYDAVPTIKGEASPEKYHEHMRDLWAFTAQLKKRSNSPYLQKVLDEVRSAQRKAMIHEKDIFGDSANGISIFMPDRKALHDKSSFVPGFLAKNYQKTRFAKDTAWDEFLALL